MIKELVSKIEAFEKNIKTETENKEYNKYYLLYLFLKLSWNRKIEEIIKTHFKAIKIAEMDMKKVCECGIKVLRPMSTTKIPTNNAALDSVYYFNYVYRELYLYI